MRKTWNLAFVLCASLSLAACGGGGGGESPEPIPSDACGVIGLPSKIIHGTACGNLSQSPVVRIVMVDSSGKEGFCTGTMITPEAVLTAAHCITLTNPVRVVIAYGEPLASAILVDASDWYVHPAFHVDASGVEADVAVVRLQRQVPLPTLPILTSQGVTENELVSIFGYGQDENGDFDAEQLKSGDMRVTQVTTLYVQADYEGEGSNTCLGDSGGPLVKSVNNQPGLVGVTSSGTSQDCGVGDNSFFTNLQDPKVFMFLQRYAPGFSTR